jgi:hypothetical protein
MTLNQKSLTCTQSVTEVLFAFKPHAKSSHDVSVRKPESDFVKYSIENEIRNDYYQNNEE